MKKKQKKRLRIKKRIIIVYILLGIIFISNILQAIPYYGLRGYELLLAPFSLLAFLTLPFLLLFIVIYEAFKRRWKNVILIILAALAFFILESIPTNSIRKYFTQKIIDNFYCQEEIKTDEILGGVNVWDNKRFFWDDNFCLGPSCNEDPKLFEVYKCN